jgi:hypothetical protein
VAQLADGAYRFKGRVKGTLAYFEVDEDVLVQGDSVHIFGEYEIRPLSEFDGTFIRLIQPPSLDALVVAADNLRHIDRRYFSQRFALEVLDSYISILKGAAQ